MLRLRLRLSLRLRLRLSLRLRLRLRPKSEPLELGVISHGGELEALKFQIEAVQFRTLCLFVFDLARRQGPTAGVNSDVPSQGGRRPFLYPISDRYS